MNVAIPVLDMDHLRRMSQGDHLLGLELLAGFESECHGNIRRLSQALVQVDWEAIEHFAARLRRACLTFGACAMAHLMAQIEEAYGDSHAPWQEWGAPLNSAWRQLRHELRQAQFGPA